VIRNPVTGETTKFLVTSADSGGKLLQIEMTADPNAPGATEHLHPRITEKYEMLEGRLHVRMNGKDHAVAAGERLEIPTGTPHSFWNADGERAVVRVNFEPAGTFEYFMETIYALASDGKTNAKSRPKNLLQAAVIGQKYLNDIALAKPPLVVQRVFYAVLAPIGRLLGYRA
jgi:mannose-6-phosphate isomerase-like protein (cupin superfamily)